MQENIDRKESTILKIIAESKSPIGSKEISKRLKDFGINLSERSVRYHLKMISEQGLAKVVWKEGRLITPKGSEELSNAGVADKVGLVSARIETLSYLMNYDLDKKEGSVILNLSLFHKSDFKKALRIMAKVFEKRFGMGEKVMVARAGERIGEVLIPTGKVGFGTLCTINFNGFFLKAGIPVDSKFGGVLQIENAKPLRFTELIGYSSSTLDPHEIFIRSKMTAVREACSGSGKILAGLREIPSISKELALNIIQRAEECGFGRCLYFGSSGQPALGMPVGVDRIGLVIPGGLNPVAACEEWGIETESKALVTLVDYNQLTNISDII